MMGIAKNTLPPPLENDSFLVFFLWPLDVFFFLLLCLAISALVGWVFA